MNKVILLNYYSDENLDRKRELIFCVDKNLNLDFINKVFIFVEKKKEIKDLIELKNSKKIKFIVTNKRRILTEDLFYYVRDKIRKSSIVIMMSCDIFLQNSKNWKNIDKNFFQIGYKHKILLGIRKNLHQNLLSKRQIKWEKKSSILGEYFDVIAFKTPLKKEVFKENFSFIWGIAGGDSLMMGLLNKYYHIFSLGKKYITYHYDVVRKKKEKPKLTFNFIEVNNNFEIGALLRIDESARVPTRQNWNYLLKNFSKPKVIYLKKNDFFFKKYLRKIYYYLLLNILIIRSKINF